MRDNVGKQPFCTHLGLPESGSQGLGQKTCRTFQMTCPWSQPPLLPKEIKNIMPAIIRNIEKKIVLLGEKV